MADKGTANLSASIFLDEIKSSISGSFNYEPAVAIAATAGEGWVFAEVAVSSSASTDLLGTGNDYLGGISNLDTDDLVRWIAIKNISTTATEGIAIDLITGTAAYNLKGINVIGAGELIILKPHLTTVADLHARTCTLDGTYGYITAQCSATVNAHVAAIIKNVD